MQASLPEITRELFHVQSNTAFRLPPRLCTIRIGKLNDQRPPDVDVSNLPNADVVSRIHAEILVKGSTYYIEDLGSSNGTYLNHTKLETRVRYSLSPGDRLDLGQGNKFTFRFQNQQSFVPHSLNLPIQLQQEAERFAASQSISLDQFIIWAVAEKVGVLNQPANDLAFPRIVHPHGASTARRK